MKVAVVAANGKAGRLITEEAVNRGMDVTAIVRKENQTVAKNAIIKDVFDLTKEDLKDFDVIANAYGSWAPETADTICDASMALVDLLKGTNQRLVIVGGAGSLYIDPEHTKTVVDVTPFPPEAMPVVNAHGKLLEKLRTVNDVKWTYISPAGDFQPEGKRTGKYILGGEELVLNSKGESVISYADYAIAFVDEIESGAHVKERISVVSE